MGAASRDLASDDPRGWRLGGSATYCSLAAARLGLRVGCLLGVDASAVDAGELRLLEDAGVSLRRVVLERGPIFENQETGGHRRQRWLSGSDSIPAEALPREWRGARGWLLVPVAGELSEEWGRAVAPGAAVGTGWQGLLREFARDGWVKGVGPLPSALLAAAGLVVVSLDDLSRETGLGSLTSLAPGAAIVMTAGESGGVVVGDGGPRRYRAVPAPALADPTGAGDVFLAALMTAWLLTGEVATARTLRFAAAAASCAVEGIGLAGVPTARQVAARLGAGPAARGARIDATRPEPTPR